MSSKINNAILEFAKTIRESNDVSANTPFVDYKFFQEELPTFSDECWAKLFHSLNKDAYIYNQEHKTWFYYNKNNIIKSYKNVCKH